MLSHTWMVLVALVAVGVTLPTHAAGQKVYRLDVTLGCESVDDHKVRDQLLEAGDTAEAGRFASTRCVRMGRDYVHVTDRSGLLGFGRYARVRRIDDSLFEERLSSFFESLGLSTHEPKYRYLWVREESLKDPGG